MWLRKRAACEYLGIKSTKTLDKYMRQGLKHTRLPSGVTMLNTTDLDAFYEKFSSDNSEASKIASKILEEMR